MLCFCLFLHLSPNSDIPAMPDNPMLLILSHLSSHMLIIQLLRSSMPLIYLYKDKQRQNNLFSVLGSFLILRSQILLCPLSSSRSFDTTFARLFSFIFTKSNSSHTVACSDNLYINLRKFWQLKSISGNTMWPVRNNYLKRK